MINISVTIWQYKTVLQNHDSSRVDMQLNELFYINVNLNFAENLKCVQKVMLKGKAAKFSHALVAVGFEA